MDLLVLVAAAALAGPLFDVAPWVTLSAASALVALAMTARSRSRTECSAARRRAATAMLVACAVFAASALRSRGVIERSEAMAGGLADAMPRPTRCDLEGRVIASPTRRAGTFRVVIDVESARCDHAPPLLPKFRAALSTEADDLARGDRVLAMAQLAPVERFWNADLGNPAIRVARSGIARSGGVLALETVSRGRGVGAFVDRARAHVRRRIDATFSPLAAPMARALVLGESDLDAEDDLAFRTSGLSHLLAVSGMHLVLVVLTFERALAFALRHVERLAGAFDVGRVAAAAAIAVAWIYADFAGGSGSAMRAAWMLTVLLAARMGGRRSTGTRALGVSTLAAVVCDPLAVFDVSFVLSLAATAGLLAFSTKFGDFFGAPGAEAEPPRARGTFLLTAVSRSVATTLAATLPCAPLIAQLGPSLPLGGLFANVLAVPLGEIAALPLCLLHTLLAPMPDVERGAAVAASGALLAVRAVARSCASIAWASLPVPPPTSAQLAAMLVAIGALALPGVSRRVLAATACACALVVMSAEAFARDAGAPRGVLRVTMLDVGQGDAILVDLPDGQAMLIDAGGLVGSPVDVGARVVAPVLRARRRSDLAIVVLSHPHPDHYGGLAAATERVRVGEVWDTGQSDDESVGARAAIAVLARGGAAVRRPEALCGSREIGGATIEVLAPCPRFDPDRGPNDNSLVIRIRYGRRVFLFVGDAERHEEDALVARYGAGLAADVLKVGHHGSATSTSAAFLAAVRPEIALVSCGARNRFGHPRAQTLVSLDAAGAFAARTDLDGALVAETDGEALSLRSARSGQRPLYTARHR